MSPAASERSSERPHLSEDQIVLGVLDAVERSSTVSQRYVSRELGIALGLVNAYVKRCIRKGLIKVSEVPSRRYAYFLTPQGFAEKARLTADYLTYSFAFFRRARAQCSDLLDVAALKGQRRVACVGAGDLAEILALVAREKDEVEFVGALRSTDVAGIEAEASKRGRIDAVVVTGLEDPRAIFAAAVKAFGAERVYAPELLKVHVQQDLKEAAE
jgi:DNA-binding MarR family transcriptional regulator